MNRFRLTMIVAVGGCALLWHSWPGAVAQNREPDPAAVARTREQAKMLDDLYKNAVVQITATYVRAQERTPAAVVAKKIMGAMAKKGWHQGRLVDGTGDPFNVDNLPKNAFEQKAIADMKRGKTYVEEIGTEGDRPVLRVATIVPAVMPECINCHKAHKEGDLLGALVYTLPIK